MKMSIEWRVAEIERTLASLAKLTLGEPRSVDEAIEHELLLKRFAKRVEAARKSDVVDEVLEGQIVDEDV